MLRTIAFATLFVVASTALADPAAATRARNALNDVMAASTELSKQAQRDVEVLRLMRDAARSLDDFQVNNAISKALDDIHKAEQFASQPPYTPEVRKAVALARRIVEPAQSSPSAEILPKLRAQLEGGPIETLRAVVGDDVNLLAQVAVQLADASNLVTKAVAAASTRSE